MGDTRSGRGQTRLVRRRVSRQQPEQPNISEAVQAVEREEQRHMTPQELYNYFQNADDFEATEMLNTWRQERMDSDNRSNDNDVQRFFHYIGWTQDEPVLLSEANYQAALQAAGNPKQLYHSDYGNGSTSAQEFAAQFFGQGHASDGTKYRHYVSGGVHGGGTYFASSAHESHYYGDNQFRGFLNSNARIIRESQLDREITAYRRAHPAFDRMYRKMTTNYGGAGYGPELKSVFAAMRGYNVIQADDGSGYFTVLNRKAMTVSSRTRRVNGSVRDW